MSDTEAIAKTGSAATDDSDVAVLLQAQDSAVAEPETTTAAADDSVTGSSTAAENLPDDQMADVPVLYESQSIDINGVRHDILHQGQDETGQPVVVLKNEETGDHIVVPLSALVGESAEMSVPQPDDASVSLAADDAVTGLPVVMQDESQTGPDPSAGVTEADGAAGDAVHPDDNQSVPVSGQTDEATAALIVPESNVNASEGAADQLQTLADQAGVEQQLLQIQHQPEVNGLNGDISNDTVLQTTHISADGSAISQMTFEQNAVNTVIDVSGGNGPSGAALEALVAGAAVVTGEDGNQFVVIPNDDGSGTGQQINLADVIGDSDGSGQTYLIQTDEGLVACSAAPPEVVEKVPQSPIDQIASNEQAILEAVLQSGNFTNGQVIHAVAGDQTMAYTVSINSDGAALIPIGPVVTPAPPTPKKIMGKSRGQAADSVLHSNRSLTASARTGHTPLSRRHQSTVSLGSARSSNASSRSAGASKSQTSNQVTVTRINPPSRSSITSSAASGSMTSESLLTGGTGPTQLSSSRRTYSKKNILWVNPESGSDSTAADGKAKTNAIVPALVSTNSNMTVSATIVTNTSVPEKTVSPVVKKQNPIIQSHSPVKAVSPPKQLTKGPVAEETVAKEPEKRREVRKEALRPAPEPKKSEKQPQTQQPEKIQRRDEKIVPAASELTVQTAVTEKVIAQEAEVSSTKKDNDVKAIDGETNRRSNRTPKHSAKVGEEVVASGANKVLEAEVVPDSAVTADPEPPSQTEVGPLQPAKRSARRASSTEKKETPVPHKPTRGRGRPPKTPVETETTDAQVFDEEGPTKEVLLKPGAEELTAAETAVPEPTHPMTEKSIGRRGRKPVPETKSAEPLEPADNAVSTPEKGIETEDAVTKASGSVRRSGRASKRKVEEDFVSEIEPEVLGERPTRKQRSESNSPEKEVKTPAKETKVDKEKVVATAAVPPAENQVNHSQNDSEPPEEKAAVPEKKIIAVTPKKRVGFREAVDGSDGTPLSSPAKRVKILTNDSTVSAKSASPNRRSPADSKLTPILKPSKETPKGRRLATPIVCKFTPYDGDEDHRKLRLSISELTEKRSHADHYEIESPNLSIHVRHQSSTPSRSSGSYSCQKCGYSTTRINNLTLHHKNQCPVVITEWQLGWQNEIKKQQIRTPVSPAGKATAAIDSFDAPQMSEDEDDDDYQTPDSGTAVPDPQMAGETNDISSIPITEHKEPDPKLENNNTVTTTSAETTAPIGSNYVQLPPMSGDVCMPSDDEDGVMGEEADAGILRSSSSLFDDSI